MNVTDSFVPPTLNLVRLDSLAVGDACTALDGAHLLVKALGPINLVNCSSVAALPGDFQVFKRRVESITLGDPA